jgi:uncharacterized protein (TIGR00369 family)
MTAEPQDPYFRSRVEQSFTCQQFMHFIGARLSLVEAGLCEIHLPFKPELTQQDGFFHAGIIATLADNAAGFAAYSLMRADASVLTVEFKLNLLAPGRGEMLVGRGRVIKSGRTLTVCRSDVFTVAGGDEQLCATGLLTMMALPGKRRTAPDCPYPSPLPP